MTVRFCPKYYDERNFSMEDWEGNKGIDFVPCGAGSFLPSFLENLLALLCFHLPFIIFQISVYVSESRFINCIIKGFSILGF